MIPLQRILNLLDGVRATATGYQAKFPAHEDQAPSLSLAEGIDGRVLLYCHAGCPVEEITSAIGVRMRDLFQRSDLKGGDGGGRHRHPKSNSNIRTPSRKRPEAGDSNRSHERSTDATDSNAQTTPPSGLTLEEYAQKKRLPIEFLRDLGLSQIYLSGTPAVLMPYRDEMGMAVAARFRVAMEGDRFRWRRDTQLCLYGLWRKPEMHSSVYVVLVEGESDAQTLWHHGINALGLPGAKAWNKAWAPLLDGFEVIYVVIEPGASGEAMLQWLKTSAIRTRVRLVRLRQYKDPSALHLDSPQAFEDRWQAAIAASTPWVDEAEAERSREVAVQYTLAKTLLEDPRLLENIGQVMQQRGYAGDVTPVKMIYVALTSR
jgi:hypothetical protein